MNADFGPDQLDSPHQGRDIYLALSGGGFRASAHHLGVLLAYLRFNLHRRVFMINGVSGGAITAGHYGGWLAQCQESGSAPSGIDALRDFMRPLIALMRSNMRGRVVRQAPSNTVRRVFGGRYESLVAKEIDRFLFHGRKLNKLGFPPFLIFTATELRSASPFYLSTGGMGFRPRWIVTRHILEDALGNLSGYASESAMNTSAALAVAVSACFPPIFRPIKITLVEKEAEEFRSSNNFIEDWQYYQYFRAHPREREAPVTAELLDGGVSDNRGINFFADWVQLAKKHSDAPTGIKFVLAYDAGRSSPLELTWLQRLSRVKLAMAIQSRIYSRRETMNDSVIRLVVQEEGADYGLHRAIPGLAQTLGLQPETLDAMLKVRTDLDRFTDTEIFGLAYAGYRLTEHGFHHLGLLSTHREPQQTFDEFTSIAESMLKPLPRDRWTNHFKAGASRLMLYRLGRRYLTGG